MRLTRQDMANMVGTTTETVIRIMSRFKRSHLVCGTANRTLIRDLAQTQSARCRLIHPDKILKHDLGHVF